MMLYMTAVIFTALCTKVHLAVKITAVMYNIMVYCLK